MTAAAVLGAMIRKDLLIAGRMRHSFLVACVVGLLMVAVLAIGTGSGGQSGGFGSITALWMSIAVAGVLCFDRTARAEYADRSIDALRLAPIAPCVLFASKLIANLFVMLVIGTIVSAVGVILLGVNVASAPGACVAVLLLAVLGMSAIGTLMSIGLGGVAGRSDLLAMIVLPLLIPLILTSGRVIERALGGEGISAGGVGMLIAIDVLYVVAGWLVYEFALEE